MKKLTVFDGKNNIKKGFQLVTTAALFLTMSACQTQSVKEDEPQKEEPTTNVDSNENGIPVYEFGDRFDRDFEGYGMAYIIVTDGGHVALCDIMINCPELYALYKKSGTIIPDERSPIKYEESKLRFLAGETVPLNARDVCPYNIEYGEEEAQRMVDTMSESELKEYVITKHYPNGRR